MRLQIEIFIAISHESFDLLLSDSVVGFSQIANFYIDMDIIICYTAIAVIVEPSTGRVP